MYLRQQGGCSSQTLARASQCRRVWDESSRAFPPQLFQHLRLVLWRCHLLLPWLCWLRLSGEDCMRLLLLLLQNAKVVERGLPALRLPCTAIAAPASGRGHAAPATRTRLIAGGWPKEDG